MYDVARSAACAKPKSACGHPDENVCHAPFPCKEDKPCQSKIFITCECQAQKQEMKCGASKAGEGNNGKSLPCNDECARLERNRRLAVALHIDQSVHVEGGDHIPYTTETLNLFAEHIKWSQIQEREFRVFATSDEERRLRFKPMKSRERNFIHSLANDFGLDSESMDPEPHRHVMVWKTPRFVSAPNKTLAESLRIRQAQRAAAGSAYNSETESARKSKANESAEPCNSFVISHPRFGLTVEELRQEVASVLPLESALAFDISFLPNEEVVVKATSPSTSPTELESTLKDLKPTLATAIAAKSYGILQLCATDSSLNITYRESDAIADGWSRVAAKSSGPKFLTSKPSYAASNTFAALSGVGNGKVTFAKKAPVVVKARSKEKMRREEVVEDWEAAVTEEEAKEKGEHIAEGVATPAAPVTVAPGEAELAEAADAGPNASPDIVELGASVELAGDAATEEVEETEKLSPAA
ncbi:FKBP12-associated protein [Oleoguttula sp. CCFEE 5521]